MTSRCAPTSLLIICFQVIIMCIGWSCGSQWASPAQEALDEVNDARIFKAVLDSVTEYYKKQKHHRHRRAESKICYQSVGCFQESGPYGYIDMLPSSPQEVNTRFLLYNSRKGRRGDTPLLDVSFGNMSSVWDWAGKAFNISAPTKVIVHGFGSSCANVWVYEMRSALMTVEDCNVICVDWENGATIPNYVRAAANTRLVGKQVAMLVEGLHTKLKLPIDNVHMIGFSLGAHVAGFAGAELKNLSRITGLDPAGPLFESQDPRARLDSTDAKFVDVIHSNGENLILGGLGSWQPMGHVDFYPNGGRMQKGCTNLFVGAVTDILWSASEVYGRSLCNHRRAYKFFTDSVSPRCHFPAVACESYDKYLKGECFTCKDETECGNMGYYADKSNGRGTLYLLTREEEPFCAHQYLVKIETTPITPPAISFGKIQVTLIGDLELNETFTITQKEDEELLAGRTVSRIIVPHPALQEFRAVQVLYIAYSGWLSSGLPRWSIDKVTLTDTFGKSLSVCKKDLVLESGIGIVLPLLSGECNSVISDEVWQANNDTNNNIIANSYNNSFEKYRPLTQVIQIGDEVLTGNSSSERESDKNKLENAESNYYNVEWKPVIDYAEIGNPGNSIDSLRKYDPENSGRGFLQAEYTDSNNNTTKNFTTSEPELSQNGTTESTVNNIVTLSSIAKDKVLNSTGGSTASAPSAVTQPSIPLSSSYSLKNDNSSSENYVEKSINLKPDRPYEFVIDGESDVFLHRNVTTARAEIKEPILKATSTKAPMIRARGIKVNDSGWMPQQDLNPPSIGATESWQHWRTNSTKFTQIPVSSERSYSALTVQYLPQRLIQFLEQAEKYARLAFSPFITESSQNNSSNQKSDRTTRRLRYLPTSFLGTHTNSKGENEGSKTPKSDLETSASEYRNFHIMIPHLAVEKINKLNNERKYIPLRYNVDSSTQQKAGLKLRLNNAIREHMEVPLVEEVTDDESS
nr:PREDICTED: uncharacterized protein LOC109036788 [Bemisia tabaci]XP_018906707.1 PREDICTED: uncharacterized protein LOC109036788 [Bemisia tabaci]